MTTLFSISLLNLLQAKIEKDMNVNMNIFTILSKVSLKSSPESNEICNNPSESNHESFFDNFFNYVINLTCLFLNNSYFYLKCFLYFCRPTTSSCIKLELLYQNQRTTIDEEKFYNKHRESLNNVEWIFQYSNIL